MSLTSELRDSKSPASLFLRERFPNVRPFQKRARDALRDAQTIHPMRVGGYAYGTVGTAFDYRARYYFAVTPSDQLVASSAAMLLELSGVGPEFAETFSKRFRPALDDLTKELNPVGRRLDRDDEEKLLCFCVVLALFDEFYRAGTRIADRSPLFQEDPTDFEDWLTIPKPEWIDDLCQMSWLFHERGKHLFSEVAVLNPTFAGTRDIGGADADIIVSDYLLDFKTSVNPRKKIREWLYQAMGYVLLDYDDEYELNGLGIYLARQGVFLQWPLSEAIDTMADGKSPPLQDLRKQFRRIVTQ